MQELNKVEIAQVDGAGVGTGSLTGGSAGAAAIGWAGWVGVAVSFPVAVGVIGAGLVIGGIIGYALDD